ncbi:nucleoside hydrolase [Bifidobacterium adolescentis]|uniref:nucleoside hydrolase n=1 Tax=Bifidobacterium adolescentis TaxID=1680 RepID=UPI003D05E25B
MTPTPSGKRKMILDVDTGIDDALALAYLVSFDDVEILGVIGTYGNVSADTAVRNTAYVLERLGFRDVPVMCGSTRPSWAAAFIPDAGCAQFHGTDGLGGFDPSADYAVGRHTSVCDDSNIQTLNPAPNVSDSSGLDVRAMRGLISVGGYDVHDPHANPAADSFSLSFTVCDAGCDNDCEDRSHSPVALPDGVRFLIDAVRFYGSDVTVVATGPLTDVDAALAAAPDITSRLRLVMMGGTLTQEGNCWDATAETNIIQDPEAADRVFHSGADVTMVGLDVTHQCLLGSDATVQWRQAASQSQDGDVRTFLADIVDFSIAANFAADPRLFAAGMPLHDPLAAAVAVDPSLVECFDLPMKVETETGDFHGTRGRTIGDPAGLIDPSAPRVHVALTVDHDRFVADFTWRIAQLAGD